LVVRMKRDKSQKILISVVAPCFNEEGSLGVFSERVSKALEKSGISFELVLVNDGSTDNTEAVLKDLASEYNMIKTVTHSKNMGIPHAWSSGIAAAKGEFVCLIDSDLQNPPEDIPRLYENMMSSRCDFSQACRSQIGRQDRVRHAISRVLNFLLNLVFRDSARDNKSGFLIGPKFALEDVLRSSSGFFYFQSLIRVVARSKGYSFSEVESLFSSRVSGKSFLTGTKTMSVILRTFLDIFRARLLFGKNSESLAEGSLLPGVTHSVELKHPYKGWRRLLFELYFASMPLHTWLINRGARGLYIQLKQAEFLPGNVIKDYQLTKLRRLIRHAYTKVPYYTRTFDGLIDDGWIKSVDDLLLLPFLEKDDIRSNLFFDLFASNHDKKKMHKISTSGSTGRPLTVYADKFQLEVRFASTLRALEMTGWRFGDRQARLWHQKIGMSGVQVIKERLDAILMRRMFIPAFEMSKSSIEGMIAKLERNKPKLIDGYAESLNFLASYLKTRGSLGFKPTAVMSSAQALPESSLKTIEESLGARVFDKYGSREFSGIAYQCGASRDFHVVSESYLLELMVEGRPARPGEIGEVVITDLNNYSVPLIRYRIGDLAVAVDNEIPCPCGRSQPRIGAIQGRTQAIVYCADELWIPGTFFAHFFKDYSQDIEFFQIYQKTKGEFDLRVVKSSGWNESSFKIVMDELRKVVGEKTLIHVIYVDSIPLLATGKRSPVVSEVVEDVQKTLGSRS
jgi:phenylacetate-CoA ligase